MEVSGCIAQEEIAVSKLKEETPLGKAIIVNVPVNVAGHGQLLSSFHGAAHKAVQQGLVGGYGGRVQESVAAGAHEEGVLAGLLSLTAQVPLLM